MKMAFFTPMHKSVFFSPWPKIKDSDKKDLDICLPVLTFLPMQKICSLCKKKFDGENLRKTFYSSEQKITLAYSAYF